MGFEGPPLTTKPTPGVPTTVPPGPQPRPARLSPIQMARWRSRANEGVDGFDGGAGLEGGAGSDGGEVGLVGAVTPVPDGGVVGAPAGSVVGLGDVGVAGVVGVLGVSTAGGCVAPDAGPEL